jgi:hypothetical protein
MDSMDTIRALYDYDGTGFQRTIDRSTSMDSMDSSDSMDSWLQTQSIRISTMYDHTAFVNIINYQIAKIVEEIQKTIDLSKLSRDLKAIMNSWVRTHSWYDEDKMSKFEHCLRRIVTKEMRRQTIERLEQQDMPSFPVNEDDLCYELEDAFSRLTSSEFWDMDTDLTAEAKSWVTNHGECLIESDFDRPFSWFSSRTMTTQYNLPHMSKRTNNIDVVLLKVLAIDIKHEEGWICSICLGTNSENPVCVKTECGHIYHHKCLADCKRVFLERKENRDKSCVPCPLCRAPFS